METLEHQTVSENVQKFMDKVKGMEFHVPDELAEFLEEEKIHFTAHELIRYGPILVRHFRGAGGAHQIPEWLAKVFVSLIEGTSPKVICDPCAGIGILLAVLREASKATTTIAFTRNGGAMVLGETILPEADWRLGSPSTEVRGGLDLAASILPANGKICPVLVEDTSGSEVKIDDLGSLLLVSISMQLNEEGAGLFVVPPSFFYSARSVFRDFGALGLGVDAAFALPAGTFAPATNMVTYLVVVRRKPSEQMFVAQLNAADGSSQVLFC